MLNKIKVKTDKIYIDKTKKDITIIHIADIHFNINTKIEKLEKIKKEIYINNPDYVMITGDLLDNTSIIKNKYKIKELLVFLTDIASNFKILISLGNHDIINIDDYKFFNKLNDLKNIYVLDNNYYKDEFIYVSGITLPCNYYYNITGNESPEILLNHLKDNYKLINIIKEDIPRISLIHSPICLTDELVLDKLSHYDLLLSGHTHNGMVPSFLEKLFPNNMGIIAPNKEWFPKIARGRIDIKDKNLTIIINGAITKLSEYSSKILSKFNFVYDISINKIIITKKRGN